MSDISQNKQALSKDTRLEDSAHGDVTQTMPSNAAATESLEHSNQDHEEDLQRSNKTALIGMWLSIIAILLIFTRSIWGDIVDSRLRNAELIPRHADHLSLALEKIDRKFGSFDQKIADTKQNIDQHEAKTAALRKQMIAQAAWQQKAKTLFVDVDLYMEFKKQIEQLAGQNEKMSNDIAVAFDKITMMQSGQQVFEKLETSSLIDQPNETTLSTTLSENGDILDRLQAQMIDMKFLLAQLQVSTTSKDDFNALVDKTDQTAEMLIDMQEQLMQNRVAMEQFNLNNTSSTHTNSVSNLLLAYGLLNDMAARGMPFADALGLFKTLASTYPDLHQPIEYMQVGSKEGLKTLPQLIERLHVLTPLIKLELMNDEEHLKQYDWLANIKFKLQNLVSIKKINSDTPLNSSQISAPLLDDVDEPLEILLDNPERLDSKSILKVANTLQTTMTHVSVQQWISDVRNYVQASQGINELRTIITELMNKQLLQLK